MPNYENGKIYKLTCDKSDKIYIGSTVLTLNERLSKHKGKKSCLSRQLLELGEVKIELIQNYPCNNKKELETKERHYIEKYKNIVVNKYIPTRTAKEWRKDNRELKKEYCKEYYQINKEKAKQYYLKKKDIISEKRKVKMTCECGSVFRKNDMSRHCKTNKHQNYLKSLKINSINI